MISLQDICIFTSVASPGPLPATPTGQGGSSIFNFNSPLGLVSPSKPFKPVSDISPMKGNKHAGQSSMSPETLASVHGGNIVNYPTSAMFAGKLKDILLKGLTDAYVVDKNFLTSLSMAS